MPKRKLTFTSIDTVIGDDTKITVHFDYQPAEEAVLAPNDAAYPGCPEDVTINEVTIGEDDIMPALSREFISELEERVLDEIHQWGEPPAD